MTKYEKLTLTLSSLALLVSLGGLGLTLWLHYENTRSELQAYVAPERTGLLKFEQNDDKIAPVLFRHRFKCQLSNVGNVRATVTDLRVLPLQQATNRLELTQSLVLKPSFHNIDGKPLSFPIALEPRGVQIAIIEIGIALPDETWQQVKSKIEVGKELSFDQVNQIFVDARIPWFGQVDSDKRTYRQYRDSKNFVNYVVTFRKEDGSVLETYFDVADFPKF